MPPAEDEDAIKDYTEDTVMGQVQYAGTLVAAVPEAPPFFSMSAGRPRGFIAGIADEIAGALGVKVRFLVAGDRRVIGMPDAGKADIAFPLVPISEKAARARSFTDPYLVSHQRLLVPEGLGARMPWEICTVGNDAVVPIAELDPGMREKFADLRKCTEMLASMPGMAMSGLDVHLLVAAATLDLQGRDYQIKGDELSTAGIGAVVAGGTVGWSQFVSAVVAEAVDEGRWTRLYRRTLLPVSGERGPPPPPDLTVEEAAAIIPAE